MSDNSESSGTRVRMSLEQMKSMKMKILMYVSRAKFPVTPTEIEQELSVCYPTAVAMLMELALEGHLILQNRSGQRYFQAVPDKNLTVINQGGTK